MQHTNLGTINYTYRNSLRYVYRIYYYRENDNFSIYRAALIATKKSTQHVYLNVKQLNINHNSLHIIKAT